MANRPSRSLAIAAVVVGLILAGCGATPQPVATPNASPSGGSATASFALPRGSPGPSLDAAWLAARAVTCGDGLFFSPALLQGTGHEEDASDPAGIALRAYLAGPDGAAQDGLPKTGWHRVAQTATRVQFLAPDAGGGRWWVLGFTVERGTFALDTSGVCNGTVKRDDGLVRADWWLDAAFPVPRPTDAQFHALLREEACASGRSPEGRIAPPAIAYFDKTIAVTMSVRPRPGGQDCQSNPSFALIVRLDQPMGERRLVDGGVFPPRDAWVPPD